MSFYIEKKGIPSTASTVGKERFRHKDGLKRRNITRMTEDEMDIKETK